MFFDYASNIALWFSGSHNVPFIPISFLIFYLYLYAINVSGRAWDKRVSEKYDKKRLVVNELHVILWTYLCPVRPNGFIGCCFPFPTQAVACAS